MTIWIAIALTAVLAAAWLARPFLWRFQVEPVEAEHAISIYRDQREELRRDTRAGLISAADRDAAEQEIERRALRAAQQLDTSLSVGRRSLAAAGVAAGLAVAGSLVLYAWLGSPEAEDRPLAQRQAEQLERRAAAGDLESRVMLLVERLRAQPDSFEDWWLLAQAYGSLGDYASAADAYRRAAELSDERPAVLAAYAEAMTLANGNKVPAAARLIFTQVRDRSNDPRARYYLALAKAQSQDFEGALADWQALYADSRAAAPWMPLVRRDIVNMARFLKRDLAELLPDATEAELAKAAAPAGSAPEPKQETVSTTRGPSDADVAAAGALSESDRKDMVRSMVTGLADRLADQPGDLQGWLMLIRSYAVLQDAEAARGALQQAKAAFADQPGGLRQITQLADSLGVTPE